MRSLLGSWQLWALLSAAFAALTAIFAKVGIENVNSDFATFIRTIVILCALGAILVDPASGNRSGRSREGPTCSWSCRASPPEARGSAISAP